MSVFIHLQRDTAKCMFLLLLVASLTHWHCSVPVLLKFVSVVQNVSKQGIISSISEKYCSWRHWGFPTPVLFRVAYVFCISGGDFAHGSKALQG